METPELIGRTRGDQLAVLGRRGQVQLEACQQGARAVFRAVIAGERNRRQAGIERHVAFALQQAHVAQQRVAVFVVAQRNVGDEHIGPRVGGRRA